MHGTMNMKFKTSQSDHQYQSVDTTQTPYRNLPVYFAAPCSVACTRNREGRTCFDRLGVTSHMYLA